MIPLIPPPRRNLMKRLSIMNGTAMVRDPVPTLNTTPSLLAPHFPYCSSHIADFSVSDYFKLRESFRLRLPILKMF